MSGWDGELAPTTCEAKDCDREVRHDEQHLVPPMYVCDECRGDVEATLDLDAFEEGFAAGACDLPLAEALTQHVSPFHSQRMKHWTEGFNAGRRALIGNREGYAVHILGFAPTRACRACGCTDGDCSGCIARTGQPCTWVSEDLCSACDGGAH